MLRDRAQAGTDKLSRNHAFTPRWPMMAWYILKNARADRGLSPDTSPPPSGLPRADSHTGRWGGGVMRPFCPDGYVLAQEAIERAARSWFAQQIAEVESAATSEYQQAQR